MIDQILSALCISLKECNKYEDPAEYIYELNQVLNRYKTNLFKMIPNKELLAYDPKELFNIQIKANWRVQPDYKRRTCIMDTSPVMLHFIGFMPEVGRKLNLEKNVGKAMDISHIIDLERINNLKTDYYTRRAMDDEFHDEDTIIENTIGYHKSNKCSIYWNVDRTLDDVIVFTMQLNGKVHDTVLEEHNFNSAARMAVKAETPRQSAIQKALEEKLLNKNKGAHYAEIHDDEPKPAEEVPAKTTSDLVGDFFSPVPQSILDQVAVRPKKTNANLTRKKHNFW